MMIGGQKWDVCFFESDGKADENQPDAVADYRSNMISVAKSNNVHRMMKAAMRVALTVERNGCVPVEFGDEVSELITFPLRRIPLFDEDSSPDHLCE